MKFTKFQCLLVVLTMSFFVISSPSAFSQVPNDDSFVDYAEDIFMDMDFEPNIATPEVPAELKPIVKKYVRSVAEGLKSQFIVDLIREGEVMILTVPTDDIFLPNDTLLSSFASRSLNKLLPLMKDPYMYKVVVSTHTDDTGSDEYRAWLSQARLNTIYEWILDKIDEGMVSEDIIVIPFSMDSDDPLTDNLTRKQRSQNRRVEFYFIPGPKMIKEADSGQLK